MSKPTTTELLPCPFCGRLPAMKRVPSKSQSAFYWWVGCEIAGTPAKDLVGCGIGHSAWSEPEAAAKWNTRTPSLSDAQARDDYVAWCRYVIHEVAEDGTENRTIETCDSDAKGAFKVYCAPTPQPTLQQIDNRAAIDLLEKWLSETPSEDEESWEKIRRLIDENRLSDHKFWPELSTTQPTLQQAIEKVKELRDKWEGQRNKQEPLSKLRNRYDAAWCAANEIITALSSLASTQE